MDDGSHFSGGALRVPALTRWCVETVPVCLPNTPSALSSWRLRFAESGIAMDQDEYRDEFWDGVLGDVVGYYVMRDMSFGIQYDLDGDGFEVAGLSRYPYRTMGAALTDLTIPTYFIGLTDECAYAGNRFNRCAGTKGLVVDVDFRNTHAVGLAVPDTFMTWATIDWVDGLEEIPDLSNTYSFGSRDEYYDMNTSGRTTPWSQQIDDTGSPVLEPMLRIMPRYDYIRMLEHQSGNLDYPVGDPVCGSETFMGSDYSATRLNGVVTGVFSHKLTDTKPGHRADVYWGFDPYRFNHAP